MTGSAAVGPLVYPWLVYNVFTGRFVGSYLAPEQAQLVADAFHRGTTEWHRVVRA